MSKFGHIVGKNIRIYRKAKGITQEVLGEMADVSGSYIGYLERGKRNPSLNLLVKIAAVLEVEPYILLTSPDNVKNQELTKLINILSNEEARIIKFINEVAISYFKSLKA